MTINLADNTPRISYTVAQGVTQTSFAVPFEFFDNGDLKVYVDGTLKTITTHYTVSGGDGSTGAVAISVTGATGGSTVVITRDIPLARTTDFPTSGAFAVATLNRELDRFTAMQADRADDNDRSIKLKDQDATSSLELPLKADRVGRLLGFNTTSGNAEAGPLIADVSTLSAVTADIATLADIEDGTDATDAIQTVAGIQANVSTVAGISGNVTTVAGVSSNVTTVAGQTTNMQNITNNLSAVQNASTNATNAASSASAASTSASAAATSATNAGTSETNAGNSATAAATSATNAGTSETNAASSATAAATSATNAATSATNAGTSETNASTSATNAATSATAASASQVAAAASAASAASSYDTFDDRYLGTKTSNPTVDNDGDALIEGALYFNSTANEMRVYDGANWIAASSAGTASLLNYHYTATAGQTTFTGADENSATLSYTVSNLIVTLNGVVLEDGADYTATNGTSVVLASGAVLNDEVNIVAFKSFTTADMVSATNGGTFQNNIAITGDLTVDTNTLFVDASANAVGLGTLTPSTTLDVVRAGVQPLRVESSSGTEVAINMVNTGGNVQLEAHSGNFNIDADNVGIGTTEISDGTLTILGKASGGVNGHCIQLGGDSGTGNQGGVLSFRQKGDSSQRATSWVGLGGFDNGSQRILYYGGGGWGIENATLHAFYTNASYDAGVGVSVERMRIDNSGNVLVGGTTYGGAGLSLAKPDSSGVFSIFAGTGTGFQMRFGNVTNGVVGSITTTSSATAFNTSSDYRLKENITDITDGITRLKLLNPSRFNFIADADRTVDGFIAHEVSDIVPEAIVGEKDAMMDEDYVATPATGEIYTPAQDATYDDDGNELTAATDEVVHSTDVEQPDTLEEGRQWRETTAAVMATRTVPSYQGIDQSKLVPLLTAALQEAVAKIETLEAKVTALENA